MTLYSKQTWNNGSAGGTPISATRLDHIEEGIETAAQEVTALLEADPPTAQGTFTIVEYVDPTGWPARPSLPAGYAVMWINRVNSTLPPSGVGGYEPGVDIALAALAP
jgi:hypothetical protein